LSDVILRFLRMHMGLDYSHSKKVPYDLTM